MKNFINTSFKEQTKAITAFPEMRTVYNNPIKVGTHRLVILLILIFGAVGMANAQLSQGHLMLGSDVGSGLISTTSQGLFGFNFGLNDGAGFNVGISPKMGYFVRDNFLLGAVVNLGFAKSPERNGFSTKTTTYGIQGLTRYYMNQGEGGVDNFLKRGSFFSEANAGIAGVNIKDGNTTNGFAFGVGPGYSYFVSNSVALETTLKYNGLVGGGNTTYQHSIGLNFGVQVFLGKTELKNRIDNPDTH